MQNEEIFDEIGRMSGEEALQFIQEAILQIEVDAPCQVEAVEVISQAPVRTVSQRPFLEFAAGSLPPQNRSQSRIREPDLGA